MIPYGRHAVTQADIDAVVDVLHSDFLTQGPVVPAFERAVLSRVRARHAVAVNSATSGLHIACLALELGPGDRFWTVPNTFVASANCGRHCGADVDFVDIDPRTWNLSVPKLREKLIRARKDNRLPKVVIPVHFAGQPTEQETIWELAQEYGFRVVEDASHSIGAARNGEPVGSCRWSDITVFSFHPVKIITTGEGGMALTNDRELAERMAMLRSHGITRNSGNFRGYGDQTEGVAVSHQPMPWYYEQQMLGFNYRMTDIQAALGTSQIKRLDENVERRMILAHRYDDALKDLALQLPTVQRGNQSAFHLYVVRLKLGATDKTQRKLFDALRQHGVGVNVHYIPVHTQPYYRRFGFKTGDYPEAERYYQEAITLPLFPSLSEESQSEVIRRLSTLLGG
jgi:UDP-4-amino-4,6-dideoxy-N-acetyl-beta-L-altrosamine transaminase